MLHDPTEYRSQALKFWEGGRPKYMGLLLLACSLAAVLLLMNGARPSCLVKPGLLFELVICCFGANICYTFGYVPELLFMGGSLPSFYQRYRSGLWWAGALMSMVIAFVSVLVMVAFHCH